MKSWTEEQWSRIKRIPGSLETACAELEADHDFLLAGDVFSEEFVRHWVKIKRKEARAFNTRPHPYEVELYLDC